MIVVTESILIDRENTAVFERFHDIDLRPAWDSTVLEIRWSRGDGPALGARQRGLSKVAGRRLAWETEIVAYQPPRLTVFRAVTGPFPYEARLTFDDFDGATRFTWHVETERVESFFGKLAVPIAVKVYRRDLRGNLERFRELVTARVPG